MERSVAVSGCKMDKMRVQSRGWACAGDADTGRGCWAADGFMDFARASGAMFETERPKGRARSLKRNLVGQ